MAGKNVNFPASKLNFPPIWQHFPLTWHISLMYFFVFFSFKSQNFLAMSFLNCWFFPGLVLFIFYSLFFPTSTSHQVSQDSFPTCWWKVYALLIWDKHYTPWMYCITIMIVRIIFSKQLSWKFPFSFKIQMVIELKCWQVKWIWVAYNNFSKDR